MAASLHFDILVLTIKMKESILQLKKSKEWSDSMDSVLSSFTDIIIQNLGALVCFAMYFVYFQKF